MTTEKTNTLPVQASSETRPKYTLYTENTSVGEGS